MGSRYPRDHRGRWTQFTHERDYLARFLPYMTDVERKEAHDVDANLQSVLLAIARGASEEAVDMFSQASTKHFPSYTWYAETMNMLDDYFGVAW